MNCNQWIEIAARLRAQDRAFALVTVLSAQAPTSAKAGDKALVTADGQIHGWIGGGCAQPAVVKTVRQALASGQPQRIRIAPTDQASERTLGEVLEFGMACHSGGTLDLFVDPVLPAPQLVVFGDSAVAHALSGLAPHIGLQVLLVAQGAQANDFPDAVRVLATDSMEALTQTLSAGGLVVVATQGRRDLQALRAALALKPSTLWFVASERKASVMRASLINAGENPQQVAAIVAPAGEPIGAQTPEEIALAVLAAVVAARRGRSLHLSTATPAQVGEKSAPRPANELTTVPTGSCCAKAAKTLSVTETLPQVEVAKAATASKPCCGG
jgi:xanthine dehydrogenase accessory factor